MAQTPQAEAGYDPATQQFIATPLPSMHGCRLVSSG